MNKFYFRRMHLALLSLTTLILAFVFGLPAADTSSSLPRRRGRQERTQSHRGQWAKIARQLLLAARQEKSGRQAYLDAENVYTDAVMKPTEPLQKEALRRNA